MPSSPCDEAERRLQVGGRKTDRGRRDHAVGQEFIRDQDRATIELGEMVGIEQPRLEFAPQLLIRQKPRAIDLVFQRRFLERADFAS